MTDELFPRPEVPATTAEIGVVAAAPMGVTAFFGHSRLGPVRTPVWCQRERDYNTAFGDFAEGRILAASIRGFFQNGGQRCVVINLGEPAGSLAQKDLALLDGFPEIELICAPGKTEPSDQQVLTAYTGGRGDVLALLDGPPDLERRIPTFHPPRVANAVMYVPWLWVHDPSLAAEMDAPPSGHMAGLLARVARERGIHKAPANEPLHGLTGLAYDIGLPEQDLLYPRGMNCIRRLPKLEGIRPWGAQTLAEREPFRTLASWRVFAHVVRSLRTGCGWLAGSASEPETWQRLRRATEAFLRPLWEEGALLGTRAEDAYKVRCDAALNGDTRRDRGQILMEIGLALQRPSAFFNFQLAIDLEPLPAQVP